MDKRKARIVFEEVKTRHIPHWDEDLMSREQLENLYREGRQNRRRYKLRQFSIILACLLLLCLYPTIGHWLGQFLRWFN